MKWLFIFMFFLGAPVFAQDSLAAKVAAVLAREAGGHSPTDDDINTANQLSANPDQLREALPNLIKLLQSTDGPARTYVLSILLGLETSATKSAQDAPAQAATSFPANLSQVLAPAIPEIAKLLTDDAIPNPSLAAGVLGGFTHDPPSSVFAPLYAYLQRDGAVAGVGFEVVQALLNLGPVRMETSVAIGRYLRRRDQTSSSRANLVDALSASPNQSEPLNKTLLEYLDSDNSSLRARLILSLPELDLAPDVFAETHAKVAALAGNTGESLEVSSAAKSVTSCWNAPKTPNCPAYVTP